MKIDRISYQKTFNIGSYQSERIGVEIELNEGEDAKEALSTAKALVHEFYMEGVPTIPFPETHSIVADNAVVPIVDIKADEPPPTKLTKEEQQKKYLTDCTTIEELNTFKLLVKNNPHLQETFDNHYKKLTT
jgi:hypothetical protein